VSAESDPPPALDAESLYREILAGDPHHPSALYHLGILLHGHGRREEAVALLRRVPERSPFGYGAAFNLGVMLRALGRFEEAVAAFARAVALPGSSGDAHMNLGLAMAEAGQPRRALRSLRRATTLLPERADAWHNLANVLVAAGSPGEAAACYRQALAREPELLPAWLGLANARFQAGEPAAAEADLRRLLALAPDFAAAAINLGNLLEAGERSREAIGCYQRAIRLEPGSIAARINLANVLKKTGEAATGAGFFAQAAALLQAGSQPQPPAPAPKPQERPEALVQAAVQHIGSLYRRGRSEAAEKSFEALIASLARDPENAELLAEMQNSFGQYHAIFCHLEAARHWHRQAARTCPESSLYRDNLLFLSLLDPALSNQELFERTLATETAANALEPFGHWENVADPERPLRVGYVSNSVMIDMNVYYFMDPILRLGDPDRVGNYLYGDAPRGLDPALLERYPRVRGWRNTHGRSPDEVAEQIRADGIDILIQVLGRAYNNDRTIQFFQRKPAPVQATFHGSMGTGLKVMDYFIADRWSVPGGGGERFLERVARLPRLFHLPADTPAPDPAPAPLTARGQFSFGFLGSNWKLNERMLELWAEILRRSPGSRLVIKGPGLNSATERALLAGRFARFGLDEDRLSFFGFVPTLTEHLNTYRELDLSLDTHPYCGGNSTLEALWMGVPVLTLAGDRFIGRMSVAILRAAGLDEFIAETPQDYIDKAVALAATPAPLLALRPTLRARLRTTPLTNAPRYARAMERLQRQLWRRWCRRG
jgi:predicted O-linked N-acetylglucosamine transferase (SPINDLY family)